MFSRELTNFGRYWDPWRELDRLQSDLQRLFSDTHDGFATEHPRVNVWTDAEGAIVTALLPGADAKSIDLSVLGETLTVRAGASRDVPIEGATLHRRERDRSEQSRTVTLPFRIDSEGVTASYRDGVLEVFLPRAPEERAKRVVIKGA